MAAPDATSAGVADPGEMFDFALGYSWALHRCASFVVQAVATGRGLDGAAREIQKWHAAAEDKDPLAEQGHRVMSNHLPLTPQVIQARRQARWIGYRSGLEAIVNDLSPGSLPG